MSDDPSADYQGGPSDHPPEWDRLLEEPPREWLVEARRHLEAADVHIQNLRRMSRSGNRWVAFSDEEIHEMTGAFYAGQIEGMVADDSPLEKELRAEWTRRGLNPADPREKPAPPKPTLYNWYLVEKATDQRKLVYRLIVPPGYPEPYGDPAIEFDQATHRLVMEYETP